MKAGISASKAGPLALRSLSVGFGCAAEAEATDFQVDGLARVNKMCAIIVTCVLF